MSRTTLGVLSSYFSRSLVVLHVYSNWMHFPLVTSELCSYNQLKLSMTYQKLLQGKRHLVIPGDATTLCGCAVTYANTWKMVKSLEGDECKICSSLAVPEAKTLRILQRTMAAWPV